jgi:hypothetical protein
MVFRQRVATTLDWAFAPEWLMIEQACFLSGWDRDGMLEIIDEGGVDLNDEGLIERESLYEFQESLALVLYWND